MYFQKTKSRTLGISPLFITGCGFVLVIFLAFYMLTYDENRNTPYEELKTHYPIAKDNFVYDFMNHAVMNSDSLINDSLSHTKLICISLGHEKKIRSFLKSFIGKEIERDDFKFMSNQFSNEKFLWNKERLLNCWTITPDELNIIRKNDSVDFWEEFEREYGYNGKHLYSIPIYNKSKTFVIIEHNMQGHWFWGVHELLAYKKVNGVWVIVDTRILSIS